MKKVKKINKKCIKCSKEFESRNKENRKFCSHKCYTDFKYLQREKRQCERCDKTFECKAQSNQRFCTRKCGTTNALIQRETRSCACGCGQTFECKKNSKKIFLKRHQQRDKKLSYRINKETIKCKCCNKEFKVYPNSTQKFCSKKCYWYYPRSLNHKKNMRIAAIKRIQKESGNIYPNYNKEASEFFKHYDEQNNTKGRYAVYGGGEYYIEQLGYWPDYINFEKRLIIEFDEKHHFDKMGNLKEKDIERQQQIQQHFKDFKIVRIKNNAQREVM